MSISPKRLIKTRTLVTTLQSLLVLPSISASIAGDVLPEAVLIKNILEEMIASLVTLASLVHRLSSTSKSWEKFIAKIPAKILPRISHFRQILSNFERGPETSEFIHVEDYDADTEGEDRAPSRRERRLKRRDKIRSESSTRQPQSLSDSVAPVYDEDGFIRVARDLLLVIQNDSTLKRVMSSMLSEATGRESLSGFIQILEEFHNYSVSVLEKPYEVNLQETETLISSIFTTQKLNKSIKKMKTNLEEILETQRILLETKAAEKAELFESVSFVRHKSDEVISDLKSGVDNKIKVMAWNSHGRQMKTMEIVVKLKKELEQSTADHVKMETDLRHTNIQLEKDIEKMISEFDSEMFRLHNDIAEISAIYETEKIELTRAREMLEQTEQNKTDILADKRAEEEEERNTELNNIRQRIAAKVIQRAWRAHRARMMLKSKKKKKKK